MNKSILPFPVERALKSIGNNISTARRMRGWSQEDFAQRLDVSLSTVRRLEAGFHGAALHTFLRALHLLGLLDELIVLTSIENDTLGLELLQNQLPKRIHSNRKVSEFSATYPSDSSGIDNELEGF